MKINLISLFPEFFQGPLSSGLMQRAVDKGIVKFNILNPRDFAEDKRQTVDDRPYGGGPGMVMLLSPLERALRSLGFVPRGEAGEPVRQAAPKAAPSPLPEQPPGAARMTAQMLGQMTGQMTAPMNAPMNAQTPGQVPAQIPGGRLLAMSPKGRPFTQELAQELSVEKSLTLLCGRYEGFDARLAELFPLEEISMGDFVLNGGETAALAVCEATARLLPGFMGHEESGLEESFSSGLLEYPHYTRPEVFQGLEVPEVLRSGDHARIAAWRRERSLAATLAVRPELLEKQALSFAEVDFLRALPRVLRGRNLYLALLHYPVLDKDKKKAAVSLTNLDIHDIARSSCTYGLSGFFVVTPLEDQLFILEKVLEHWTCGAGAKSNPDRKKALSKVIPARSLEEAVARVEKKHGERPLLWGSSAALADPAAQKRRGRKRKDPFPALISFDAAGKILYTRPAVLLLGTSHGLAPEVIEQCDHLLPPLRRAADYNHLSVRCAGTVLLDRLLGEWG